MNCNQEEFSLQTYTPLKTSSKRIVRNMVSNQNISFHMTVTLSIWGIRRKRDFKKAVPLFWMKCNAVNKLD